VKYLFLGIAVFLYLQPVAVEGCTVAPEQAASQHAEHAADTDHDCCDADNADPQEDCDHVIQCGACAGPVSAVAASAGGNAHISDPLDWLDSACTLFASHSPPPYKPPIS
jgi:hypothetical protein